jgi:hypothetical protein
VKKTLPKEAPKPGKFRGPAGDGKAEKAEAAAAADAAPAAEAPKEGA